MHFVHPDTIITERKIIELFVFTVTANVDGQFLSCISKGVVQEIAKNRVNERAVALDLYIGGKVFNHLTSLLFDLQMYIIKYILNHFRNITRFFFEQTFSFIHLVECGNVLQ